MKHQVSGLLRRCMFSIAKSRIQAPTACWSLRTLVATAW